VTGVQTCALPIYSINVLRGLGATVSQTTKLANETTGLLSAVQKLLPLIAGFFL
jgi:hypothetical protein